MENINKYIKMRNEEILKSSFDFKGLFELIHNQGNRIFAEYLKNYQVKSVSYIEMKSYCLKAATYLKDKLTSGEKKFVAIHMENSVNWVACFWGILALGYNPMLLNCKLPRSINEDIIKMMGITTVISWEKTFPDIENEIIFPKTNDFLPEIEKCDETTDGTWGNMVALSTTATSMNYKVCVYTGRNITYQVLNAKGVLSKNKMVKELYEGYLKQLAFLPFYHIFGLVAVYFWFSVFGRVFVFLNDYSSDTIFKTIQRTNVTHVFAVPLLWNTMAREIKKEINLLPKKEKEKALKGIKFSLSIQNVFPTLGMKIARRLFSKVTNQTMGNSIKFLITGGGYISDETLLIMNAVGYPLFNGYGSTEIGITSVELRNKAKFRMMGSVGQPFDFVKYKIEDDVLLVSSKSSCSMIFDKEGNVTELSEGDFYNTKDMAKSDKLGYFFISGRIDDVFIGENGEKINPDLIEKKCMITGVDNYCILSYQGELSLVFEFHNESNDFRVKQVSNEITKTVEKLRSTGYNISRVYYSNDCLINPNAIKVSRTVLLSKINRGEVKLKAFEDFKAIAGKNYDEVKSDTIERIRCIFADVLCCDISKIDVNKHFIFDLGGTSIDYCTLLMRLKDEYNIDFKFENQSFATVLEFWKYIESKEKEENVNEAI